MDEMNVGLSFLIMDFRYWRPYLLSDLSTVPHHTELA